MERTILSLACQTLAAVLAALPLGATGDCQVTPANQIVIVDAGRTANVRIKVEGCKPTWSVESHDENVATAVILGSDTGPLKTISIKGGETFGTQTTVTVTLNGVGSGCESTKEIELMVFVVMRARDIERAFTSGSKGANIPGVNKLMGQFRKDLKSAEKDFRNDLKQILKDMKAGELGVPGYPPDPGFTMDQYMRALLFMTLAYQSYAVNVYALYWQLMSGMGFCGINAFTSYAGFALLAYMPLIAPLSMQPGGGGSWDKARLGAFKLLATSLVLMVTQANLFTRSVLREAAKNGQPLTASDVTPCIADPGDGGTSPISAKVPDDKQDLGVQLLRTSGYNSTTGNPDQGRIVVTGRSGAANVTVKIQKTDANGAPTGPIESIVVPVDSSECAFWMSFPDVLNPGSLSPGAYRVVAEDDDGHSALGLVAVPSP